jgi:hypothetical protein
VVRDSRGVVSRAEAVAKDIDLPLPDGGRLRIDQAKNVAETKAHGRTGSAQSTLKPSLRGVTITNSAGTTSYHCDECDPVEVAERITAQSPDRLGASVPRRATDPGVAATPRGAQAVVLKDPYEYWNDFNVNNDTTKEVPVLQLTYYNDSEQPSRLVVQLAGVLAESHFTVGLPYEDAPTTLGDPRLNPGSLGSGGGSCELGIPCAVGGLPPNGDGRLFQPANSDGGTQGGLLRRLGGYLLRHPGEALLLTLVWALLGTPLYLTARRRSLISMKLEESI